MRAPALRKWLLTVAAFGASFAADRVLADALVVTRAMTASTIAEIFVDESEIRVEIEIGAADIEAFRNILPDQLFERLTGEASPQPERLRKFLEHDWLIRTDDRRLPGTIERIAPAKRMIRDEITGDPLPTQPDDAEVVIRLALRYALDGQPKTLSICPPLTSDTNTATPNIGFVVYHLGVAVNDFRYLSAEETLQLDWSDPWYSAFDRKTLKRRYFAPAAAFLYVENFEVRKEIIFRPKDLQQWVDLGLEGKSRIKAAERDAICQSVAVFLAEHTPVEIDGKPSHGTLDRIHFIQRTLRASGVVEPNQDIDVDTALIGAIYVYPIDALPQQVTMGWDLFSDRITQVPTTASDEAGGLPSYLEPGDALLVWQNFLTNPTTPAFMAVQPPPQPSKLPLPIISLFCFVAICAVWISWLRTEPASRAPPVRPLAISVILVVVAVLVAPWTTIKINAPGTSQRTIPDQQAADVVNSLLHNVYRAFDYRDESTIYDVLDRSISGDLLTTIYLETRQSLTLANQGGARVKVQECDLVSCKSRSAEDGALVVDCQWIVAGSVGHWGHIHQRRNQYHGEFVVRAVEGQWKITGMELLSEERI